MSIKNIKKTFLLFSFLILKLNANPMDEIVLALCHTDGVLLYSNCVAVPVTTSEQVTACSALKIKYLAGLAQLTLPNSLTPSIEPDPYMLSPWSPCKFETSHLVIPEICNLL